MSDDEETAAIQRLQKKLTKENLFMYILRLLQDKEHYGYELRAEIKKRFGFTMATVTSYAEQRLQTIKQRIMSYPRLLEIINTFVPPASRTDSHAK